MKYQLEITTLLVPVNVHQLWIIRPTAAATLAKHQGADHEKKNGYRR